LLESSSYFSSPRTVKYFMPSIDQAYNEDGTLNTNISLPNPIYISQNDIDDSKFTRIITNNSLEWETPIENLVASSKVSIDYQVYNYKRYRNRIEGDGSGTDGYGFQANSNRANYVFQNSLNYTWDVNDDHSIDFTVLQEYQKNRYYYLATDADSFSDDGLTNLNSAGNPTSANSYFEDWSVASYLALAHYSAFNGKYILDGTYRREGNSRFSADNRWGDFGSVGVAWNMHKENFLNGSDIVNNLKLRASYGITGNANIDLNQYQALLNYDSDYAGEGASYPGTFGNADLSWETSHTLDVGIEFGLFQNLVSGSVAYYRRESKDLLLDVPLSLTTGFDEQTRNIGSMENKGFEVELNANIIRSEKFNFSLGGNVATNENKVLELATDANGDEINITSNTQQVATGHPVYGWFMPTWAGVDPANGDELYYVDGEGSETTNNFNDANSVWQGGSAIPKVTAGANLHIDYSGFFLDANAYYSGGSKVYEEWHRYTNGTDFFSLSYYQGVSALLDRWQEPGDEARYGRMQATTFPWQRHSKFLYDGDFIRVKNITLGYDFASNITDIIGLDAARIFVRGTNLFTWVKDDHLMYDPETAADGFTSLTTPPVKSVIFGVNVKF
ncbi:MAG: SusC/RagA family TonB-linked outer membrane protein, partial [Leeuwenhoekiella sp.]